MVQGGQYEGVKQWRVQHTHKTDQWVSRGVFEVLLAGVHVEYARRQTAALGKCVSRT